MTAKDDRIAQLEKELHDANLKIAADAEMITSVRRARDTWMATANDRQRELDQFKKHATEVLHQEAEERGFCSDFDDVMEQIGLPKRATPHDVTVEIKFTVNISVTAADEEAATKAVTRQDVLDAIDRLTADEMDEWEAVDAEQTA